MGRAWSFGRALLLCCLAGAARDVSACESPGNVGDAERMLAESQDSEALRFPGRDAHSRSANRDPAQAGSWRELAATTEVLAVNAALLATGKVLVMAGSANDHSYRAGIDEVRLFDPATETILGAPEFAGAHVPAGDPPTLSDNDIFCAGHSFLADGRLLVVGGNLEYPTGLVHREPGITADLDHTPGGYDHPLPYDNPEIERPPCHGFLGLRDSFLFDPVTLVWTRAAKMARGRWYPSTLALPDGRVLAINGYDDVGRDNCRATSNRTVETFEPSMEMWSAPIAFPPGWPDDRYPFVHLLPSGDVFYAGPNPNTFVFDPATLARIGSTMPSARGYRDSGGSVLLPFLAQEGYRTRVLNFGGAPLFGTVGRTEAEILDLSAPAPAWRAIDPMHHGRMHVPSALLPDGTVFVPGGSAVSETVGQGVLEAEIFDPVAETWSLAAASSIERHYHSVAVLLPDARVWVAGSNPDRPPGGPPDAWVVSGDDCDPDVPCHPDPWDAHGHNELRMDVYSPPYLHRGARPQIAAAPDLLRYGESFDVGLAGGSAAAIARAVLVRPAATTHGRSMDQRLVGLVRATGPASGGEGTLTLVAPPSSAIAPPGDYMLFVLDADGVPSVARFVRLAGSTEACTGGDDLDDDSTSDACDAADAPLSLTRTTLRADDGDAGGRLRIRAELGEAAGGRRFDALASGIALRVADAAAFDYRAEFSAAECRACGQGCSRCTYEDGRVLVKLKEQSAGEIRATIRATRVALASPAAAPVSITLTDGVPVYQQGIDWSGTIADCETRGPNLVCRAP